MSDFNFSDEGIINESSVSEESNTSISEFDTALSPNIYFDKSISILEGKTYAIPILSLNKNEHVLKMIKNPIDGTILFLTSLGRILESSMTEMNIYKSGYRSVYSETKNSYGFTSQTKEAKFLYALQNKMIEVNEEKSIDSYIYAKKSIPLKIDTIKSVFVSPIIKADNDIGSWSNLIWTGQNEIGSSMNIYFRNSDTISNLYNEKWNYGFNISDSLSTLQKSLNGFNLNKQYLQIKIETTIEDQIESYISSVILEYTTKNSSYFYTTKFSLENGTDANKGMLVANVYEPKGTEVQFGVSNKDSSDWKDYTVITKDEFFKLENYNNIKVGIRMISYNENLPNVSEFSLITNGFKANKINE
jgi:hypothetical protein